MGMDSLMAVELRNRIQMAIGSQYALVIRYYLNKAISEY